MIEFNPSIPNNIVFVQPRDMSMQQGSSLLAIVELAKHKNYELVSTTTYNAIFVQRFYFENVIKHRMADADNCIHKMHDTPMQTQIFQLYDGKIKIAGCKKLIWHKIKMDEEKMQIIPKNKRHFPFAPPVNKSAKYTKKIKKKKKQKRIKYANNSSVMLFKAMTFVAIGFMLGRIY